MIASQRRTARRALVALALPLLALSLLVPALPAPTAGAQAPAAQLTSALTFRNDMRKLWEDHITWTRLYIVSALGNLPDKDATTQRLLANQVDIGNAIKPFYGNAAGDKLTSLLKDHILGAAALLAAAQAGDNAKAQEASNSWYANADDIAAFLSAANPTSWPLDQMKAEMKMHLNLTLNEAVDHLKGNYAADVADYDKVHEHILGMADALSSGIIHQFPDRFTTPASDAEVGLSIAMRKLWEDHITWTRLYIVSASGDLPDKDATTQRLLANQVDIGNAIKPFYGDAAGDKLTSLLKDHILGAAALLAAAKSGDNAAVQSASDKWYANANDIAGFLAAANPDAWPLDQMKAGMKMHLDLTLNEAVAHLKGDYAAGVADYDKVHEHILGLADTLAAGIVAQFPNRFPGTVPAGESGAAMPMGMPRTGGAAEGDGPNNMIWPVLMAAVVLLASGWLTVRHSSRRK